MLNKWNIFDMDKMQTDVLYTLVRLFRKTRATLGPLDNVALCNDWLHGALILKMLHCRVPSCNCGSQMVV